MTETMSVAAGAEKDAVVTLIYIAITSDASVVRQHDLAERRRHLAERKYNNVDLNDDDAASRNDIPGTEKGNSGLRDSNSVLQKDGLDLRDGNPGLRDDVLDMRNGKSGLRNDVLDL